MKDKNLQIIKTELAPLSPERIILFGSRANGRHSTHSDYDLMLLYKSKIGRPQKLTIASTARKRLAEKFIDADIIVKTDSDFEQSKHQIGSISRQVFQGGITL